MGLLALVAWTRLRGLSLCAKLLRAAAKAHALFSNPKNFRVPSRAADHTRRERLGPTPLMSAVPLIAARKQTSREVREVPCVDGSVLARRIFTSQAWVGAAMCSASHDGFSVKGREGQQNVIQGGALIPAG